MKSSTRAFDRVITGLVGLILLGGGGWLLAYRLGFGPIVRATHRLLPTKIAGVDGYDWWPATVGGIGVLLILLSVWLLLRHLQGARSKVVATPGGGSVDLSKIADAVASDVGRSPLIQRARATTLQHKGKPAIRVFVSVAPGADVAELRALTRTARQEVKKASSPDVELQLLVNGERS